MTVEQEPQPGTGAAAQLRRTPLHERHRAARAKIVDFGGWAMPIQYGGGIVAEHLATRRAAGLFDVSHMGRFTLRGAGALPFLQHVLTNNAAALDPLQAQYTIVPTATGGAVDDAYLYRFTDDEYLLVVNAANRENDWDHFQAVLAGGAPSDFGEVELVDRTFEIAMIALQGPRSRDILSAVLSDGGLPEPLRNELSIAHMGAVEVRVGRTGYTGEPICFELFVAAKHAVALWDALVAAGAEPVGLGARDTLRLEAGLPLYGQELGLDPAGVEIPIFAIALAPFVVSLSSAKGDFIGREALTAQQRAYERILVRDWSLVADLPKRVQPVAVTGPGVARQGAEVFREGGQVGWVTSGTAVPYWNVEGDGLYSSLTDERSLRTITLAYLDSRIVEDDRVEVDVRGRRVPGLVVPYHLRSEAPPYARSIVWDHEPERPASPAGDERLRAQRLLEQAIANHEWRQERTLNLIPSEMTPSPMVRLLSITDPAFRYAEHKQMEAFYDLDVFYYQGTGFIDEVERLAEAELRAFLGCSEVETRPISGQMANMIVFSAMVDYLNRADRKAEPRRIRKVINNHLGKGGHLSAQPMGALRDFVARDPRTELPAVVDLPVQAENPYRPDVPALLQLIEQERPELIVLGKSMVLHPEPVYEVRQFVDELGLDCIVMYDMAHVLGLVGPHFQLPFSEGADLVTGSTHKTFFGPQRGIVAGNWHEPQEKWELWEAIERRAFPGSVSNHHLGTLLALLMAAYEMNHFKDAYQRAVIANAKTFARALHDTGLDVAGDPDVDYTETHQVIVRVGYGRGPEVARRLEDNDVVCNYQAAPDEEGFTAAGALRLGVAELTRFGFGADDWRRAAELMAAVVREGRDVRDQVHALRAQHRELGFCFSGPEFEPLLRRLHELV